MTEEKYKPRFFDLFEVVFDIGYLSFDLVAGILFFVFSKNNPLFVMYGVLTLTLCFGDAFHLIPRVKRALNGTSEKIERQLGIGLQISSITMTVFYVLLLYIWKLTFPEIKSPQILDILIWASAIIRIAVCLLPQNDWTGDGNLKLSIIRNTVFAVTGICVIILYKISGNSNGIQMGKMVWAIIISFLCYIPVTVFSKKFPKIGALMMPKTCAYIWMIAMGLQLLFAN